MNTGSDRHSALLRRGSLMRIEALAGHRVACQRGMVWLTQDRDPLDRVLCAGESFTLDRPGIVLINALAHDAIVHYPEPARCTITRTFPDQARGALSLAAEIGHINARIEPQTLRAMPVGIRREALEGEVRRMRSQVVWLIVRHARRVAETVVRAVHRSYSAHFRSRATPGRHSTALRPERGGST
jgi:hypothetical protein